MLYLIKVYIWLDVYRYLCKIYVYVWMNNKVKLKDFLDI